MDVVRVLNFKMGILDQTKRHLLHFGATAICWCANTEGKYKFFACQLVRSKLLIADRLAFRNWPCNLIFPLCDQVNGHG